ncbi:MAG: leucine-rich repeat protein [Clostridiales bacterium]|nr:leucine-rich repeat protein [Clostridiales bacterium]
MRKLQKKLNGFIVILMALFFCVSFFAVGCANAKIPALPNPADEIVQSSQELEVLQSDFEFSQEEKLSRIKADYLKQNGGYRSGDVVTAIVVLEGDDIIDTYLESAEYETMSAGAYAKTKNGATRARIIKREQDAVIDKLFADNLIVSVENRYDTILNGFSVNVEYGKIKKLEEVPGVESVMLSDTFNRPQEAEGSLGGGSGVVNPVDVYETGIFNAAAANALGITGKGTSVAILDSGFDCSHIVFSRMPDGPLSLEKADIAAVLPETRAASFTPGLELNDVWYSEKIPFMYDYADKDYDVFPYDSEHGTHVAGIIGGHDPRDNGGTAAEDGYVVRGVATDTQLVLMKVFPDLSAGAETDDILYAVEDAVKLEVDCINMSLGMSCGFAREPDGDKMNEIYGKIETAGITLVAAASNSYSSAFGGDQGNTNMVTNPDSATVGSPSTYSSALSVASVSGVASRYLLCNDTDVVFFLESSSISGKQNDFIAELYEQQNIPSNESRTFDYVTVPGNGSRVNYIGLDVKGKIALVRRGSNTFEDKALQAKVAGAAAIIIYNNVEGDIAMSMGKTDHIPCVSISKDVGTRLAAQRTGTMKVAPEYQAGPFMSDFSSWGPCPDLQLKPEITGHGGTIISAVPGGGYDEQSGTSMASPNTCGAMVLIRQFLKDKFPEYSPQQIVAVANQIVMSTATVLLNEQGVPYSPRKQGAGLASLNNVIATKAYLSVDGKNKAKLELYDDPDRTGVYDMNFNIVNYSDDSLEYDLSIVGMSETVSSSDDKFVAETGYLLGGDFTFSVTNGAKKGNKVTVAPNTTAKISLKYKLSSADKKYIDSSFPYGMYVEGFVKLAPSYKDGVDLNIPFLAFYGDWTQAPMFDLTYYDVESEAHDESIDDEDKIKADYFATTPYGTYYYNYIVPLGTYLYTVPAGYDEIPATREHIAVSEILGTIDGFSTIYGGLLRNAKTMTYTITDKLTGEVVYDFVDYNGRKAYSEGGTPIPYYELLNWQTAKMNLVNNRVYEFKMVGLLDYGDGGLLTNMNNTFSFDFTFDNEAPVIKSAAYEKTYDSTRKKDRYYVTLTLYDNHYVQSVTPIIFNSASSYSQLVRYAIPVYSEKGKDNRVRIEITDILDDVGYDALITSALGFMIDDYALNSNFFICQLPGTRGDFKFTKSGEIDGTPLTMLTIYENEIVDLTQYLATSDATVDAGKDYLKYLNWNSSNTDIATVQDGLVRGLSVGRSTITVTEQMNLKRARLLLNVKKREEGTDTHSDGGGNIDDATKGALNSQNDVDDARNAAITDVRFAYFETTYAYSVAGQTSQIGETGSRIFVNSLGGRVEFYPGEAFKLFYEVTPWYVSDKYEFTYSTTNDQVVTVDQNGLVTAVSEGSATISLRVSGSNLIASLPVTVKSEFIIENRVLVAYKGNSKVVKIPDDEGILYIDSYAFCLYDTDRSIQLTEDDYDANKIPMANPFIEEVIVPNGVEEIRKYAFYNCPNLRKVTLLGEVKFIREYAFYADSKLEEINIGLAYSIGERAFYGCSSLTEVDLTRAYAIGKSAFQNCTSLIGTKKDGTAGGNGKLDLTALRNTGESAFQGCVNVKSVILTEHTKLSKQMFAESGLTNVTIYERVSIPDYCFAGCEDLEWVVVSNDLYSIGEGAFASNPKLTSVSFKRVNKLGDQVFYNCASLEGLTLPDCEVSLGNYLFLNSEKFTTLRFGNNTALTDISGATLRGTSITTFVVPVANSRYMNSADGHYLLNKTGDTILFASNAVSGDVTIPVEYKHIGAGAFSGLGIKTITFANPSSTEGTDYTLTIGDYAFAACDELTEVVLPNTGRIKVGHRAFYDSSLSVINLNAVDYVDSYAFASTKVAGATIKANAHYGEGAFFRSALETVTIGANAEFGFGAFQGCDNLTTVAMPAQGGVHFGRACFFNDAALSIIDLSKTDGIIEEDAFYRCTSLKSVNLAGVTEIGNYAFADCRGLTSISIPDVKKIGDFVFGQYDEYATAPQIKSVVLPASLAEMGQGVFFACNALKDVRIDAKLTEIPDYTFGYCESIERLELPATIKRIGVFAFAGCTNLADIDVSGVEVFEDYAFTSSKSLTDISLESAKSIGFGAFADTFIDGVITANNLTSVGTFAFQNATFTSFSAPKLVTIGIGAFAYNPNLTEFVFSRELESISQMAFLGCTKLKSFYFMEEGIKSDDGKINDYALLDKGILYVTLPNGEYMLASVPAGMNIETLTVRERTLVIDFYAGNENANVVYIVLPGSVRSIGNFAFYGYKKLLSVEFRSVKAPTLESTYVGDEDAVLDETDPGYGLLHSQFDLADEELYYYTFKDMAGKQSRIAMILPANSDVTGYDSIIYQAFFGTVDKAIISDYVAMDAHLADFIDYAKQIMRINVITMADETLIDKALTELEAITKTGVDFGYTKEEWNAFVKAVRNAKNRVLELKGEPPIKFEEPPENGDAGLEVALIIIVAAMLVVSLVFVAYSVVVYSRMKKKENGGNGGEEDKK